MFVLSTHGDQKRRGKMALDRAFCFGCLCVALTGPGMPRINASRTQPGPCPLYTLMLWCPSRGAGLVIFGFTLFGVDDMLSSNLVLYNKVIERWNVAGKSRIKFA